MKQKYLFDDPHWEIYPIRDFESFFGALLHLVPEGSILCLGEGHPDEAIQQLFQDCSLPDPDRIPLIEFAYGQYLPINKENILRLQQAATCHAEPEIATNVAVSYKGQQMLEWFDATFDPITVSLEVPEDKVKAFCLKVGVKYEKVDASQ